MSAHLPMNSRSWSGITNSTSSSVAPSTRRPPDIAQDRHGFRVGPVVDDVLEHVGIATFGHRVEEGAALDSDPVRHAVSLQQFGSAFDDLRQVVQHATCTGRRRDDGRQQPAVAAADIDDGSVGREVVGGDHRVHRELRHTGHRIVENRREVRGLGHEIPPAHAAQLGRHGLTGPDRVEQAAPVLAVGGMPDEPGHARHRHRRVRPQGLAERIECEPTIAAPDEDAFADQRPHQPGECVGVGADTAGQFVGGQWAVGQRVGDLEFGGHGDALRAPGSDDHLHHRGHRGHAALMDTAEDVAGAFQDPDDFGGRHLLGGHGSTLGQDRAVAVPASCTL